MGRFAAFKDDPGLASDGLFYLEKGAVRNPTDHGWAGNAVTIRPASPIVS